MRGCVSIKVIANGAANLLVKRFMGPFWIRRRWLKKTQWLSVSGLEEIQLKLLQKLIQHCYSTVSYYKQLMDERGITVESIKTLQDIEQFPILTKKDVLLAGDSIISTKYPRWLTCTAYTGGTTGTPMLLNRSLFSIGNEHAFVRRQWDWASIGFNDRCAYFTGRLVVKPDHENRKLYAYDPIMKELILSTYHLSPRSAKNFAMVMKKYMVKAVVGYPSAVHLLARTCLDAGIELELQSALTSSETLTESMRKTIAEAFHCKVFDFYGAAERVCYIFTCEQGSYHVIPEYGLTELIPAGNSGDDLCRVVSTGFWNMAMPLIRYETDDIVVKSNETCPCGRAYQVIKSVTGRKGDVIKTPSGREFGAAILTHLLYGTNNIHLTIEYVPSINFSKGDLTNFSELIAKHLPSELRIDLKQVSAIKKTVSGKFIPLVSHI